MTQEDDILAGARAIRSQLQGLLGEKEAVQVDEDLQELFKLAEGDYQVESLILQVLTRNEASRQWFEEYLRTQYPAETGSGTKEYERLPSLRSELPSPTYRCPKCKFEWHRRSVGQKVPKCPNDQSILVPVNK